jgi:hypothetical protein
MYIDKYFYNEVKTKKKIKDYGYVISLLLAVDAESVRWKLVNEFIKSGYVSDLDINDTPAERKKRLAIPTAPGSDKKFHLGITQYHLRKLLYIYMYSHSWNKMFIFV